MANEFFKELKLEMKLDGSNWTDVSADVRANTQYSLQYGMPGHKPTQRIATTGRLKFSMDNSAKNSGGLRGYYSPGHTNVRTGFELNVPTRLSVRAGTFYGDDKYGDFYYGADPYYRFIGKLRRIRVIPGLKGERRTECTAFDFIHEMSKHKMDLLALMENTASGTVFSNVIANMDDSPDATSYATGIDTFPYAGDDMQDERTTALAAARKITLSEFGYIYIKGDEVTGGVLVFEDRQSRVGGSPLFTIDDGDLVSMEVSRPIDQVYNKIRTLARPREVGSSPEVLSTLRTTMAVRAGAAEIIKSRYADPDQRSVRIAGKDLQDGEGYNELTEAGDSRSMEDSITGWAAAGDDSDAVAQSAAQAYQGSKSLLLTSGTGASHTNFTQTDLYSGYVQSDDVYVACWVYLSAAWPGASGVALSIAEYDSGDVIGTTTEVATTTTTGSWIRLAAKHTIVDADAAKLRIMIGEVAAEDFSGGAVLCYIDEVYLIDDGALNIKFGSTEGSGANDKFSDVHVVVTEGATTVSFAVTNTSGAIGYINLLQAKGTAIRVYEPVERIAEDAASQVAYDDRHLKLDLVYQDDPLIAQERATALLAAYKDPRTYIKKITLRASRGDSARYIAKLDVGDRITLSEDVTGISAKDYIIHRVSLNFMAPDTMEATYLLRLATTEQAWLLGVVNYSELADTTILGGASV